MAFDRRSFLIDGRRELLLSGAVHYSRIHPDDWDRVMKLAVELNLDASQLLGSATTKLIEGTPVDVTPAPTENAS